jgi:hypothetical protein
MQFLLNICSMLIKDNSSLKQLIHLKKKLAAFTILFLCSNVPKFSCYNLIYHFDISQFSISSSFCFFWQNFTTWRPKRKGSMNLTKECPKLTIFWCKKKVEIAIFRPYLLSCDQYIVGFQKKSTFFSNP